MGRFDYLRGDQEDYATFQPLKKNKFKGDKGPEKKRLKKTQRRRDKYADDERESE